MVKLSDKFFIRRDAHTIFSNETDKHSGFYGGNQCPTELKP